MRDNAKKWGYRLGDGELFVMIGGGEIQLFAFKSITLQTVETE